MEQIVNALIENVTQVGVTFVVALIGVAGTWLCAQIGKAKELGNIQAAVWEAKDAAQTTVLELKQTVVDQMKAASVDGKLTQEEISELNQQLISMSMDKLSDTAVNILTAAGVDISAIVTGAAEALIGQLKPPDANENSVK